MENSKFRGTLEDYSSVGVVRSKKFCDLLIRVEYKVSGQKRQSIFHYIFYGDLDTNCLSRGMPICIKETNSESKGIVQKLISPSYIAIGRLTENKEINYRDKIDNAVISRRMKRLLEEKMNEID